MNRKPVALLIAIVSLAFASSAFAADPVNIEIMAVEEEPGQMVLTVSAVDENGQPFPGLDSSSFNAWINDTALIVSQLSTSVDREPASILLLVDASGSMAGESIEQARIAITEFINVLEPQDEIAMMAFNRSVELVRDFTSDRALLEEAVAGLTLTNDTRLYDGVMEAAAKMADIDRSRKLVVLLSDGLANVNLEARDGSIQAARESGVSFISVSLGANTDIAYLTELTSATGGELIEAATPAELREAYRGLALSIRSQYTLVMEVPRSIDRTVSGTLKVHVIHRADNAFAERALDPLPGATPPPFTMSLNGIDPGDKHNGVVELIPMVQEGIEVVKVEYVLDGEVIHTTDGIGDYTLDASLLENGSHVLKVIATDVDGREGEVQVPFLVPVLVAPSEGSSLPIIPILIAVVLVILAFFIFKSGYKRWQKIMTPTYSRVDTWTSMRVPGGGQKAEEWSDEEPQPPAPAEAKAEVVQGHVVIMDEAAVQGGELETIREFEMKSLPLTFGSGPQVDMRVGDAGGTIAAEEARVWVQRGRMVYHKLTTLSAMATEGVTAGWQFLDDGDEMRIGPYRLIFKALQEETSDEDAATTPEHVPQEHGMALRVSFGLTESDRNADTAGRVDTSEAARPHSNDQVTSARSDQAEYVSQTAEAERSSWDAEDDAKFEATAAEVSNSDREDNGVKDRSWDDPPAPPAPMLEPKSADWLVEQSQPIESGMGHIVQPDAWGGFISSDDNDTPAPPTDDSQGEDEEPEERAWGT